MPDEKKPRTPDLRRFTDIPVTVLHDWDGEQAKRAIRAHDLGFFFGSAQLAEAMIADDRVAPTLRTRILGLLGCDLEVKAAEHTGDDELAQNVADELLAAWDAFFPNDVLAGIFRWGVMLGVALAELCWTANEDGTRWDVSLRLWHPQFIWYDITRRTYVVNTQNGQVDVTPGDGKWFLWTPHGHYRGWIEGAVRPLVSPWISRTWSTRDWDRFNEVHGLPMRVIMEPADAGEPEKDYVYNRVANLGSENTLSMPQGKDDNGAQTAGWDVKLVEAEGGEWESFEGSIKNRDVRICLILLGQNLTTEVQGGAYSAAQVHDLVRLDYKRNDNRSLKTALCEQVFRLWVSFNFGRVELTPDAGWQVEPPENLKAEADTMGTAGTAITTLQGTSQAVDTGALLKRF
jgi:hypothetical protein